VFKEVTPCGRLIGPLLIIALVLPLATTAFGQPVTTKSFSPSTIPVGGGSTLSFTVNNPSTTAVLTGVQFSDTFPAGLVVANPTGVTGGCPTSSGIVSASPGGNTVGFAIADNFNPSETCTFSVNVVATTVGVKINSTGPVQSSAGAGAPG